jgi:pathogenesis-related protein 1
VASAGGGCDPRGMMLRGALLFVVIVACGGCIVAEGDGDGAGGAGSGGASAGSGTGDVEPEAMSGMTAAHNAVRANVMPAPAEPMPELLWDAELAAVAQAYAERCVFEHSGNDYGENLYAAAGQAVTPQQVVDAWASEVAVYDYASNGCSGVCGHYTQIVWAGTRRLGCGAAHCTVNSPFDGFAEWDHWVCNYDPPGNWVGEKPY